MNAVKVEIWRGNWVSYDGATCQHANHQRSKLHYIWKQFHFSLSINGYMEGGIVLFWRTHLTFPFKEIFKLDFGESAEVRLQHQLFHANYSYKMRLLNKRLMLLWFQGIVQLIRGCRDMFITLTMIIPITKTKTKTKQHKKKKKKKKNKTFSDLPPIRTLCNCGMALPFSSTRVNSWQVKICFY